MSEVTLISEDGIKFYVSISVVRCIGLFKNLLDLSAGAPLPPLQVPNVTSLILEKIIEYLKNYVATRDTMAAISSAGGATNVRKTQAAPLKVKTTISNIIASSAASSRGVADDDDDDDFIDESQPITTPENGTSADFEMPAAGDDSDEFLDFTSFDDQSLRLFTPFEQSFFASLEIPMLIEITKAANFMHIPHLLDSCCKAIANLMKGLTVEELRAKFNIKNDFTPEEEERVRRETAWIEE